MMEIVRGVKEPYRRVPYMFIAPRTPGAIALLANEVFHSRYGDLKSLRSPDLAVLARLIGGQNHAHGELLSYLFDQEFTSGLIEMGERAANAWLNAPPDPSEPWQLDPLDAFTETGRLVPDAPDGNGVLGKVGRSSAKGKEGESGAEGTDGKLDKGGTGAGTNVFLEQ